MSRLSTLFPAMPFALAHGCWFEVFIYPALELFQQARTRNQTRTLGRDVEFGGKQVRRIHAG